MNTPYYPTDPPTGEYANADPLWTPPLDQPTPAPQPSPAPPRPPDQRRRLMLLAATFYMPVIVLAYALYLFGPTQCVAGPFCALITAPGIVQILLLTLGFGALYFLVVQALTQLLDGSRPARSEVERVLRRAARYEMMRPLLGIFGGVISLTLLVSAFARTLTLPAFIIGGAIAALFFWLALAPEP